MFSFITSAADDMSLYEANFTPVIYREFTTYSTTNNYVGVELPGMRGMKGLRYFSLCVTDTEPIDLPENPCVNATNSVFAKASNCKVSSPMVSLAGYFTFIFGGKVVTGIFSSKF